MANRRRAAKGRRQAATGNRRWAVKPATRIPFLLIVPLVALSLAVAIFGSGCETVEQSADLLTPDAGTLRMFLQAEADGYAALDANSLDVALTSFAGMIRIIPASPMGHYHTACAYGRTGSADQAAAALRTAIDLGFSDIHRAGADPDLQALRSHSDWELLVAAMSTTLAAQREALHSSIRRLAAQEEPPFPALDSLNSYYDERYYDAHALRRVYSDAAAARSACEVVSHRLAALERFKQEHTGLDDRYGADLNMLVALEDLPEMDGRPWVLGREATVQVADRILSTYPDSAGAARAALWKVRAAWYGREVDETDETDETSQMTEMSGMTETNQTAAEAAGQAITELLAVARRYPGTSGGGQALAEAIATKAEGTAGDLEAVRPLVDELSNNFTLDGETLGRYAYAVNEFVLRLRGAPDFTVLDTDGQTWQLSALHGKVVLLDFWATWCAPCIAEMPTLIKIRDKYASEDFQILGVCLDQFERLPLEEFRAWTAQREMTWPQIYDGIRWETPVARLYNVPGIPFPVLIGSDGKVMAAAGGARGESLEKELEELFGY